MEQRWGDAVGRAHVVACRSPAAAARLAVASLQIAPGDEIICPVDATPMAAALAAVCEAVPVFADLDPETLHLDPAAVESAVSDRTRAVLVVERHGATADHRALEIVARRHDLALIEDGSESLGASYDHRPVGALGTASFCRLPPDPLSAPSAGALYSTDDADQAANARRILLVNDDFGLQGSLGGGYGAGPGWSYRISEVEAVAADSYLNRLDYEVAVRTANGRHLTRLLADLAGIWMPVVARGASPVYSSFPLLVQPDELGLPETAATALRDTLIDCTTAEGLWMDRWQPAPISIAQLDDTRPFELGLARIPGPRRADFPVADAMWASGLVLGHGRGLSNLAPAAEVATSTMAQPSFEAMDRIADCFTKILADNVDRLRQLTLERMRATP